MRFRSALGVKHDELRCHSEESVLWMTRNLLFDLGPQVAIGRSSRHNE